MSFTYFAFGLTWLLPFPAYGLGTRRESGDPDVVVQAGEVPKCLPAAEISDGSMQCEPGKMLLRGGPRSGRFLAEGGAVVTLQKNPGADELLLQHHFMSIVLPAVLRQRGMLVLHASTAITPAREAIALAGGSGAGKSTTLMTLLSRGCTMLSDDVTALTTDREGLAVAIPGTAGLRLTRETAARLGVPTTHLHRPSPNSAKVVVSAADSADAATVPLRLLAYLAPGEGEDLEISECRGAGRIWTLQDCIFGPMLAQDCPRVFEIASAMEAMTSVVRITRPRGRWTNDALASLLLDRASRAASPARLEDCRVRLP